ncbi:MAG: NADP-dependent oxidoreductase [Sphingomonadaceae bacterium]
MQRISLVRHIEGVPTEDDFRLEELPLPEVPEGRFLVRNRFVSADPGTRSRLSPGASYAPPLKPGDTVDGFAVGRVVESRHPDWPVGALVTHGGGWASHALLSGRGYCLALPDLGLPHHHWVGALGVPGMTAWFGLRRVAALQPGETVLVSSAAGPVGATAGQLARHFGAARVVGLAGSEAKRAWLMNDCRFDAALDYRAADLDRQLDSALPDGIDILFDNVGNAMIDRMLPRLRRGGRIVVSGQVADYNLPPDRVPGIRDTRWFIASRLRMEGLVVFDDLPRFAAAQSEVAGLIRDGALATREVVGQGLASLPGLFAGLFTGDAFGRRIADLGADLAED